MEKITSMNIRLLFACLFIFLVQSQAARQQLAPALYIFGDSVVDAGNNNGNKQTLAKANHRPYGIDFPAGATGRFSNGQTIADLFAHSLGIPNPPAIVGFNTKKVQTSGFNYASASSGILDESGLKMSGWNLNMNKQVKLFRATVRKYLPLHFKSEHELASHLSKSIFLVVTGSNDYALNFFQPLNVYNTSKIFNPLTFADHLLNKLGSQLQELYKLGARKFVLFEIAPLGCLAPTIAVMKPRTRCVEEINTVVNVYNAKLPIKLNDLSASLKGSTFITAKTNKLFYDLIMNPTRYGFTDSRNSCCPNHCYSEKDVPCKDRNAHVFWDDVHPSEATSKIAAAKCFSETGLCSPMSLRELALKK